MPIPKKDANATEPFSSATLETTTGKTYQWVNEYVPSPDAVKFHQSTGRRDLAGGARGGGKTRAIVEDVIAKMLKHPGVPIIVGRKDFKDIKHTTMQEFLTRCPDWMYDRRLGGQFHMTDHFVRFFNESRVDFVELKDYMSQRSRNSGMIYIEEASEVPDLENVVRELGGSLRWSYQKGLCKREACKDEAKELAEYRGTLFEEEYQPHYEHPLRAVKMTSNPHGGWLKRTFFTPWKEGYLPRGYNYYPFSVFNNPGVDRSYINSMIQGASQRWIDNFVYGNWDIFENLAYPNFSRDRHLWRGPVPLAQFVDVQGGIDWGHPGSETAHKTAIYLTARLRTGQLLTFYEKVFTGVPTQQTFALLSSLTKKYRVSRFWADGSQSVANDHLFSAGIPVRDAARNHGAVADGINEWNRLMELGENGEPGWYVTSDCPALMAGLESYEMDPDTLKYRKVEDDEVDAGRYNIVGMTTHETVMPERTKVTTARAHSRADERSSILRRRQEERRDRLKTFVEGERWVSTHPKKEPANDSSQELPPATR